MKPARRGLLPLSVASCALVMAAACGAAEFSVTPTRAELKPGVLSETISVTNHTAGRLRVNVKLMEWTQDANGQDVYKESSDLIYFPRQLDIDPEARRLVRVGAKTPGGAIERTYRLFIEEEPAAPPPGGARVAFYFRFGVPVFLPPANARPVPDVAEPTLEKGKLAVTVRNTGNAHFRLTRVNVTDGAAFSQDIAGWYSLAGSQRTYSIDLPRDMCRKAPALTIVLEGEGLRIDRKLNVDPARCA